MCIYVYIRNLYKHACNDIYVCDLNIARALTRRQYEKRIVNSIFVETVLYLYVLLFFSFFLITISSSIFKTLLRATPSPTVDRIVFNGFVSLTATTVLKEKKTKRNKIRDRFSPWQSLYLNASKIPEEYQWTLRACLLNERENPKAIIVPEVHKWTARRRRVPARAHTQTQQRTWRAENWSERNSARKRLWRGPDNGSAGGTFWFRMHPPVPFSYRFDHT